MYSYLSECSSVRNRKVGVAWLIQGMRSWISCTLSLIDIIIHLLPSEISLIAT